MVFEERLEYLRKLIKEQDKIKNDAVEQANQHLGLVHSVEEMKEIKKEVDDKMKSKNLAITEKGENKVENENTTFELPITNVNNNIIKSTLNPTFIRNDYNNKYNTLTINNIKFILIKKNENPFITPLNEYDKDPRDMKGWLYTDELHSLIFGNGNGREEKEIRKIYLDILNEAKIQQGKTSEYYKKIRGDGENKIEGSGYEYEDNIFNIPNNPILLFIELRKLLAAKKAGHDNTYNQVNAILKRLLENKVITNERYSNILQKHYAFVGQSPSKKYYQDKSP